MNAQETRLKIQELLGVDPRGGNFGPITRGAFDRLASLADDAPWPPATTEVSGLGDFKKRLVSIALREVGTKEIGENGGPRIRTYQAATNLKPDAWPWCAAFVCWLIRESCSGAERFARPMTAGAWDFERWAREQVGCGVSLIKPKQVLAQPGDIVVFTFSHIGLCVGAETAGFLTTVEGNTNGEGAREGDGVYQKTRKALQVRSLIRFE